MLYSDFLFNRVIQFAHVWPQVKRIDAMKVRLCQVTLYDRPTFTDDAHFFNTNQLFELISPNLS